MAYDYEIFGQIHLSGQDRQRFDLCFRCMYQKLKRPQMNSREYHQCSAQFREMRREVLAAADKWFNPVYRDNQNAKLRKHSDKLCWQCPYSVEHVVLAGCPVDIVKTKP